MCPGGSQSRGFRLSVPLLVLLPSFQRDPSIHHRTQLSHLLWSLPAPPPLLPQQKRLNHPPPVALTVLFYYCSSSMIGFVPY